MKTIFQALLLLTISCLGAVQAVHAQNPADEGNGAADDSAVPLIQQEQATKAVEAAESEEVAQPEPAAVDVAPQAPVAEVPPAVEAQPASVPARRLGSPLFDTEQQNIRFSFSRADWKAVLDWFSEEAELSLEYDQLPTGSFTYSDPVKSYSISESLDIINLGLMKRGFALVRRGRSLQVIDLEVDNADKLISEIAELVKPEELDARGESDIVSCVFALGSMSPDAAKEELAQMVGPWGRVIVLTTARQVKVTETAAKLKAIRTVLETSSSAESNVVQMELEHRPADELLELARPLVGLEPGENVGEDLRISVSVFGNVILATGDPAKVALLEAIIKMRDKPLPQMEGAKDAEVVLPLLRRHFVATADIATVFDVLQTMLADVPDTRIGLDPNTKAVIAFARPATQDLIEKTIAEMEGKGQDFKVLNLRRLDPSQALLTINKFFGVTDEGGDGPIVDGDPVTGQLWVRGTTEEIALVEKLLSELEGEDALSGLGDKVRILPYTGRAAEDALRQVQDLWRVTGRSNEIRTFTPSREAGSSGGGLPERRIMREPDARNSRETSKANSATEARLQAKPRYHLVSERGDSVQPKTASDSDAKQNPSDDDSTRLAQTAADPSVKIDVGGSDIIVQFTPAGMVVASEDVEALNQFQALMDSIATPSSMQSDLPTIFWLKYCKADATAELISSVLGGSEGTLTSAVDSVTGGGLTGMLGLLGGGGGGGGGDASSAKTILTATGSVMLVPEMRLNALIVQANPVDLQMIEMILEKVDRAESPENIETSPQPALIPVIYQDANEVAEVIKSVFAERIAGNSNNGGGGGGRGGGGGQPSPQDFINALRGGRGGGRGSAPTSEPVKISIAVASTSNSLVVIASPQDFLEVKALVEALDYPENEEIVGIQDIPGNINPEVIRLALESILGTQVKTTSQGSSNSSTPSSTSPDSGGSSQSAADIARRTEFFNRLRAGGAFGGPGGPGGRGGGGPGGGFGRGGGAAPGGGGFGRGGAGGRGGR